MIQRKAMRHLVLLRFKRRPKSHSFIPSFDDDVASFQPPNVIRWSKDKNKLKRIRRCKSLDAKQHSNQKEEEEDKETLDGMG